MIRSIKVWQMLNEVRLPNGMFKVLRSFSLKNEEDWDIIFSKGNVINIDTANKKLLKYNILNKDWDEIDYRYLDLMKPDNYRVFKDNTERTDILPKFNNRV